MSDSITKIVGFVEYDALGTAPSAAPSGKARQYYDSSSNTIKISSNGGGYSGLGSLSGITNTTPGQLAIDASLGPITHLSGPTDQPLRIQAAFSRNLRLFSGGSATVELGAGGGSWFITSDGSLSSAASNQSSFSITNTWSTSTGSFNAISKYQLTYNFNSSTPSFASELGFTGSYEDNGVTNHSGNTIRTIQIRPTINCTSATRASNWEMLLVNPQITSDTTGTNYLLRMQSTDVDRFTVRESGSTAITNSGANDLGVLDLTKSPSGSQSGVGVTMTMGANTTGHGIRVNNAGTGAGLLVDYTGSPSDAALWVNYSGPATTPGSYLQNSGANNSSALRVAKNPSSGTRAGPGLEVIMGGGGATAITDPAISISMNSDATGKGIYISGTTVTANAPLIDLLQTWNSGGVTFRGIELAISDTASASASTLFRLRAGASGTTDRFSVDKNGTTKVNVASNVNGIEVKCGNLSVNPFVVRDSGDNVLIEFTAGGIISTSTSVASWVISNTRTNAGAATEFNTFQWQPTLGDGGSTDSSIHRVHYLKPTFNFTASTGSWAAFQIDAIETSNPSGTNYLLRTRAGASGTTDMFGVRNSGQIDVVKSIDTTAGDSATVNSVAGRFRKDTSGTTFTLTNSFITADSIILLTPANAAIDATATTWTVSAGSGSATITFNVAPTANFDMNFLVMN